MKTAFLDRELSQLAFNRRVMAQAEDATIPVLERLRYLCIVSSNLDEFFEVRVASLLAAASVDGDLGDHPASLPRWNGSAASVMNWSSASTKYLIRQCCRK